jgi:ABC-2 type transport system permease protein
VILAVVRAAWTMLRRDRAALALTFVVPVVFFSVFALIFGGQRSSGTRRVKLIAVDEDASARSKRFLDTLAAEKAFDLRRAPRSSDGAAPPPPYDRAAAEAAVRGGEASVALVVPRGFAEARFAFGPPDPAAPRPKLVLLVDSADPIAGEMTAGLLQKALFTGQSDLFLEGGIDALDRVAPFTPEQRETFARLLDQARAVPPAAAPGSAGSELPVDLETIDLMGESKRNPLVAFYAAGLGVMFLLFSAAGAGGALIEERESGTLDRLLATRITMGELLAGKLAHLATLGVVQLAVMFTWGWLVFGLELPGHVAGFLAMAIPTALACSAFGLVLAAVCRTRKQLVAASNLVILTISAVGGSMFPRFLMPEGMKKASLVFFNSWALEGFLDVFWREEGLAALLPEIGVLLVWTVALFAIARRVARQWEVV